MITISSNNIKLHHQWKSVHFLKSMNASTHIHKCKLNSTMQSKNINLTLSAYTNMKYAPLHLKRRSGHAVAERLIQSRSPNIKGPFVYCFYGPNNIMKRRPLYSETINNYRACLVSCCPDADREGRQTTRRHIKGSQ